MLFTKETDYAIRFFRTLRDGEKYPVSKIAERELIPQQFAYKILRKLSGAGLITVVRGARGGCVLNADLNKVSVMDLIEIVEPKDAFVPCMEEGYVCPYREENGGCRVHENLGVLEDKLKNDLSKISINELLGEENNG